MGCRDGIHAAKSRIQLRPVACKGRRQPSRYVTLYTGIILRGVKHATTKELVIVTSGLHEGERVVIGRAIQTQAGR
jgi:hypothetical protein